MDFYLEAEAKDLLCDFESAFSKAWDTAPEIEQYIKQHYDGDTERFIFEVSHSCDYFSLSKPLRLFLDHFDIESRGTTMPARGGFSDGANPKSQNHPPEEDLL